MVAIAIDFKKAYDSIKRETMVQILKELRIDSKIIDCIVRIYMEDSTKIQLEKNQEIEIEVTSGIRQGCTASTVLFKLITYKIIEEMRKTEGIQILGPKITSLLRRCWINISKRQRESRKKYRNNKRDRRKVWPTTQ